ncbi:CAP domain-containing protein [Armatimonas sp.]|uniref:CAP domain-containing protein n=1 Tax=Armatimonas sp. TaxID=1872638 RepID=UPI00286D2A62|nr:CAP domain-containing protein [Armatimonas sp.]
MKRVRYQDLWEGSEPRPQGKTPQERPQLVWQMQPKGSAQLRRIQMRVNGKPIPTRYDAETKSITGEPQEPLPLGTVKAFCEAWFSTDKGVEMEWEFIRVPQPPPPPTPDFAQQETVAKLNQLRRAALLPDAKIQPALCLAAARHSRYLLVNRLIPTHDEEPGKPEFYGKDHTDRSEKSGYFGLSYEVIASGESGAVAVQRLMDAPYHRAALLQPGTFDVGAGLAGNRVTLLCALTDQQESLVYPADGQLDVAVLWDEVEIPDPLRLYPGAERITGYPITLHVFGEDGKLSLLSASLTGPNNQPVASYTNSPENDDALEDTILLMPKKPLLPLSTYRARIAVKTPMGREITRSWQFTTGKAPAPKPLAISTPKPTPKPQPKTVKKKK